MFRDMHVDHIEPIAGAQQTARLLTVWRSRGAYEEFARLSGFAPNLTPLRRRARVATTPTMVAPFPSIGRRDLGFAGQRKVSTAASKRAVSSRRKTAPAEHHVRGRETSARLDCVQAKARLMQGNLFGPPIPASLNRRIDGASQTRKSAAA